MATNAPDWATLVQAKRERRSSLIPRGWRIPSDISARAYRETPENPLWLLDETRILTPRERQLTDEYDATALLEQLSDGSVTSVEVTTAFCKRAAIAQQLINPLTEIFFDKALERAKVCDAYLKRHGKPMGCFHGLPISLKDMFMVKGEYTTLGFVACLQKPPATKNSAIVDMLLADGAVLFCKTNVPHGLTAMDGSNQVLGYNLKAPKMYLTPEDSLTGEGALVGFRGSPLGVGTDIGGSIRSSLLNGVFGFKPTAHRLPWSGQQFDFREGWPGVLPTVGPHAHSARDLTYFCKAIIEGQRWKRDSTTIFAPWRHVERKTKLRVGLWMGMDERPLSSPATRALEAAAQALEAAGHVVTRITTPEGVSMAEVFQAYMNFFGLDIDYTLMKIYDERNENLTQFMKAVEGTSLAKGAIVDDMWESNIGRDQIRDTWHKIFAKEDLDVVLCPGHRSAGSLHDTFGLPCFTSIWDLLNCPTSLVPFLQGKKEIDKQEMPDYYSEVVDQARYSVQLAGWTGQDEEVLMATEVIADVLSKTGKLLERRL